MKKQLIAELTSLYKKSLNPSSKWYNQDIIDFKERVAEKSVPELQQQLANLKGYLGMDSKVNKLVSKEVKLMDKSGMFDVKGMNAKNALS